MPEARELRQSDDDLFFDHSPLLLALLTPGGVFLKANPVWTKALGRRADELVGRPWLELLHPDDRAGAESALATLALRGLPAAAFDARLAHASGGYRLLSIHAAAPAGREVVVLTAQELSAKRHLEEELRRREAEYSQLFDQNPSAMFIYDVQSLRFLAVNDAAVRQYGYSREEFSKITLLDIRPEEDVRQLLHHLEAVRTAGGPQVRVRWRHRRKDGTLLEVEVSGHELHFQGRRARVALIEDITGHRKAVEALRRSELRFRRLTERSPDAVALVREGKLIYVNPSFVRTLGFAGEDDLLGRPLALVVHPDDRAAVETLLASPASEPGSASCHARFLRGDGALVFGDASAMPIELDGAPGRLLVVHDVTERRRLEARLQQNDRMATLGTFAAGIVHEISNPLAYVISNLELLLAEDAGPTRGEALGKDLRETLEGALRMRTIVQGLRSFSQPERDERLPIDVRAPLQAALRMVAFQLKGRGTIEQSLEPAPLVLSSEAPLAQVFLNLLVNAVQALPKTGDARIFVRTGADAGRALVEIADTGCGIPPENLPRLFDPFFTTKPSGLGTGLGLSICHRIVASLGGDITVESEVGRGTTLRVFLLPAQS